MNSNRYEVAPGLWIGSEISDINREIKRLMRDYLDGDDTALSRITQLSRRKEEIMKPARVRKMRSQ